MPRLGVIIVTLFILCIPNRLTAQPAADEKKRQVETPLEYAYGSLLSISSQELILSEYDFDREENVKMRYEIGSPAEFSGAVSISNFKVGDDIEVYYKIQKGQRTAVLIVKEMQPESNSVSIIDADDEAEDEGAVPHQGPQKNF